jgi:hypothetical protein
MDNEETTRKARLLDLFLELEESERRKINQLKRNHPAAKYERMFKGFAIVTGINGNLLRLERENGKKLKSFEATAEITKLIKKGDQLMMISGKRQGVWRLIRLDCMGSEVQINNQRSMHISVMRRPAEPSQTH